MPSNKNEPLPLTRGSPNPLFRPGLPEFGNDALSKRIFDEMMKDGLPPEALKNLTIKPERMEEFKYAPTKPNPLWYAGAALASKGDSGPSKEYWDKLEQREREDQLTRDAELSALAPRGKRLEDRIRRDFLDSLVPGMGEEAEQAEGQLLRRFQPKDSSDHPGETLSNLYGISASSKKIPDEVPTDAGGRRVVNRMYPELPKVTHLVSESDGIYKLDPKTKGVRVPKVEPIKGDPFEVKGSWRPDPEALRLSGYKTPTNPRPRRPSQVSEVVNQYVEPGPLDVTHPSVEAMHRAGLDGRTGKPINPPKKPDMRYLEGPTTKMLRALPKAGLAGLAAWLMSGDRETE